MSESKKFKFRNMYGCILCCEAVAGYFVSRPGTLHRHQITHNVLKEQIISVFVYCYGNSPASKNIGQICPERHWNNPIWHLFDFEKWTMNEMAAFLWW